MGCLKMSQSVLPIKDSDVLKEVQDTLLHDFQAGQRNYTIFQVSKVNLSRVRDVLKLRWADGFNETGTVRQDRLSTTPKTVKPIYSI